MQKSNPLLRQAVSAYNRKKTVENHNKIYSALLKGPLLIAVESIPESFSLNQSSGSSGREHTFNALAVRTADNSLILAVFTDEKAVAEYEPGTYMIMEPVGLLEIVQHQYDGIVINPGDQEFCINRDSVKKILNSNNSGEYVIIFGRR
ncbi:MAG: SseB family protein [Desulfobacterales bacterium]|nr:SseB family protein [Desulfobacterales bacterium]